MVASISPSFSTSIINTVWFPCQQNEDESKNKLMTVSAAATVDDMKKCQVAVGYCVPANVISGLSSVTGVCSIAGHVSTVH